MLLPSLSPLLYSHVIVTHQDRHGGGVGCRHNQDRGCGGVGRIECVTSGWLIGAEKVVVVP